ncbi:MAG: ATP-binding cassette domain-containing protein [Deltaproteobacteria bacterium]|nr:ATP-binding cassette domain-containing protein [Deltaproteobacteria bacterium]
MDFDDTEKNAAPNSPAIETKGLTMRFKDFTAVDAVNLKIPRGEIFGLLGPNGAGKTTTIKMFTTLLKPTAGVAIVAGLDVSAFPSGVRKRIGYVPQMLSADGALTAYENLMLSAKLYGMKKPDRKGRIADAINFMGLNDFSHKLVKTYSGGMIRRLELAQAMLHKPEVLFLDEPTIGLDPVARRVVWERLIALKEEYGITILITTHDMEEADQLCDEIAIMHQGKIAATGSPASLKASVEAGATLNDVFVYYSGGSIEEGGNYRDVRKTRRTASRMG